MNYQTDLFNTAEEKQQLYDVRQFQKQVDAINNFVEPPEIHRELFKVDEQLFNEIYAAVDKILHDPPLHAWFDPNYQPLEQTFTIQIVNGVAFVNYVPDIELPVNQYKVKDFTKTLENGKWEPDIKAIRDIKIYYYVCK